MKTKNVVLSLLIIIGLITISCDKSRICIEGSGAIIDETLAVSDFTGIDLVGVANVVVTQGTTQEVTAIGHANIIDRLKTNVSNGIWKIELENGCYKSYELTIYVTLPLLRSASISGTGNITINDFENQLDLSLAIPGSGNIEFFAFNGADQLDVNIDGSGTITGKGSMSGLLDLNIDFGGAGNFKAFPVQAENCNINISGSGNCEIYAKSKLDVTVSGSGSIFYKGNPAITTHMNAAGSLVNSN